MSSLFAHLEKEEKKPLLIYRYRCSEYVGSRNRLERRERLEFLKSKSTEFGGPAADLVETGDAGLIWADIKWPNGHPRDNQLYNAVFVPGPPDWETGYIESWFWKMEPWKEQTERQTNDK